VEGAGIPSRDDVEGAGIPSRDGVEGASIPSSDGVERPGIPSRAWKGREYHLSMVSFWSISCPIQVQ